MTCPALERRDAPADPPPPYFEQPHLHSDKSPPEEAGETCWAASFKDKPYTLPGWQKRQASWRMRYSMYKVAS